MYNTLGKHSKPPPVTLSKANDRTLSGTIAANLQAVIAPGLIVQRKNIKMNLIHFQSSRINFLQYESTLCFQSIM